MFMLALLDIMSFTWLLLILQWIWEPVNNFDTLLLLVVLVHSFIKFDLLPDT